MLPHKSLRMSCVCTCVPFHFFYLCHVVYPGWNDAQRLSWSRSPPTLSRGAMIDLTAALRGTSAPLIFPAGVAAVSTQKGILPLSLSPEIWKQHCASKAVTVIPLVCSAPHLLEQPLGDSQGRLLPREDSCRVGGLHYTCSSGNNYHIVLNFIALGCSLHTRANAPASLTLVFRWLRPQQPAHFLKALFFSAWLA